MSRSLQSNFIEIDFQNQLMNAMLIVNMFFRLMKHFEFIRLINMFRSNTKILKRTLIKDIVRNKLFVVQRKILQDKKSNIKINIALNNWTSSNNLVFMRIIDYFIDREWRLREILLDFKSLWDSHTDKFMFKKIVNLMKNHKIERQLLRLINDNVENNDKMHNHIRLILKKLDIEWNHEKNHISCLTHVI